MVRRCFAALEVNPDLEFQGYMDFRDLTAAEEYAFGQRLAQQCFAGREGLPLYVEFPRYRYAADAAVTPAGDDRDFVSDAVLLNGRHELKTLRGLGPQLPGSREP
ncbi:MAG: hypothetical protein ABSG53_24330 [Thermoguttaceae bacterium]